MVKSNEKVPIRCAKRCNVVLYCLSREQQRTSQHSCGPPLSKVCQKIRLHWAFKSWCRATRMASEQPAAHKTLVSWHKWWWTTAVKRLKSNSLARCTSGPRDPGEMRCTLLLPILRQGDIRQRWAERWVRYSVTPVRKSMGTGQLWSINTNTNATSLPITSIQALADAIAMPLLLQLGRLINGLRVNHVRQCSFGSHLNRLIWISPVFLDPALREAEAHSAGTS